MVLCTCSPSTLQTEADDCCKSEAGQASVLRLPQETQKQMCGVYVKDDIRIFKNNFGKVFCFVVKQ